MDRIASAHTSQRLSFLLVALPTLDELSLFRAAIAKGEIADPISPLVQRTGATCLPDTCPDSSISIVPRGAPGGRGRRRSGTVHRMRGIRNNQGLFRDRNEWEPSSGPTVLMYPRMYCCAFQHFKSCMHNQTAKRPHLTCTKQGQRVALWRDNGTGSTQAYTVTHWQARILRQVGTSLACIPKLQLSLRPWSSQTSM